MSKYKGRTTRILQFRGDVWPIMGQWADQNDFTLVEQVETSCTYKQGTGLSTPAKVCKITWDGSNYVLEAWLQFSVWLWIQNLFLFPKVMVVDGGGMKARPARNKAKNLVNSLLQALGESELA